MGITKPIEKKEEDLTETESRLVGDFNYSLNSIQERFDAFVQRDKKYRKPAYYADVGLTE
jgi:hypothetical protein